MAVYQNNLFSWAKQVKLPNKITCFARQNNLFSCSRYFLFTRGQRGKRGYDKHQGHIEIGNVVGRTK